MKILIIGRNSFIAEGIKKYSNFLDIKLVSARNRDLDQIDFSNFDVVIFLSALVHQTNEISKSEYFKVNTELPVKCAKLFKSKNIKQFVFLSSASVYGDYNGKPFTELSECSPTNYYGESKLAAEKLLLNLSDPNFIVSIIRPPLVYGENVKANMLSLIKLVERFSILPFGNNSFIRSLVATENLVAIIDCVIEKRVNGIFLATDNELLSIGELSRIIAKHLNRKLILIKIPKFILTMALWLTPSLTRKLFSSFVLDKKITSMKLNYHQKISPDEQIRKMIKVYLSQHK